MNYMTITIEIEDPNDIQDAERDIEHVATFYGTVTGITVEESK